MDAGLTFLKVAIYVMAYPIANQLALHFKLPSTYAFTASIHVCLRL
ncbi:MAG: hypothetical protein VX643_04075 [Chloroflexota bacterium]|nr:hypothetical protein [Chloroflexota bacterium]